jgi:glycine betaine/choline ABC-type transport system substrate-binding protein
MGSSSSAWLAWRARVFAPISKKLTTGEMQKPNAKVHVEGQLEDQVAEERLKENGFI